MILGDNILKCPRYNFYLKTSRLLQDINNID